MKDLQAIIKLKAEKKLNNDIENFFKFCQQNNIFQALESHNVIIKGREPQNLRAFFWNSSSEGGTIAKQSLLDKYVEIETKIFMDKIERLDDEITNLKNEINN